VILSSRALRRGRIARGLLYLAAGGVTSLPANAVDAQTDEIQVYDAEINNPGVFSLQLHNNYTPVGREQPDFNGGIAPNHTLNGVPEWALGITDWLELGAYAPVYSWTGDGRFLIDGAKLRAEFVVPQRRGTKLLLWGQLRAELQRPVLGADPHLRRDPADHRRASRARRPHRKSDPRYFIPRSGFVHLRPGVAARL
jgi:hypothetical protein